MKKIYKYPLGGHGITTVEVPGGGTPLFAGLDIQGNLYVWIELSGIGEGLVKIQFSTVFTGHEYEAQNMKYLNSFVGWGLMIHVFQHI